MLSVQCKLESTLFGLVFYCSENVADIQLRHQLNYRHKKPCTYIISAYSAIEHVNGIVNVNRRTEMRIRTGLTDTLHCRFYRSPLYGTIAVLFRTRHSHCNVSDKGFEHVVVAGSCSIHWPGEYPPTPPSPHSLNTFQVSRYETGLSVAE